jgi:hypothetical protein
LIMEIPSLTFQVRSDANLRSHKYMSWIEKLSQRNDSCSKLSHRVHGILSRTTHEHKRLRDT